MTPKATPTVARLSSHREGGEQRRPDDDDHHQQGDERDRDHDQRDPFPGDRVVVGQLGGAAGDARFDVGVLGRGPSA